VVQDGITVEGDRRLLRIVLENVLGNAWKFTGKTAAPKIKFGSRAEEGKQVCYVQDNGVGFDMKYAGKLFAVFQRLHTAEEFEGTGVGLAIVERIIHRHGGRIWATSAPEEGATFYFTV
jgi:light-regulated signal transduction histidine kinase (bacteriophytochrome)